jgi:Mg2+/Co2+ transporter CorB
MTVLVVVFGEVMPKTYALNHADRVALALAPAVRLTVKLFAPLAAATQLIVGLIYKLFGADIGWRPSLVSASEEIRSSIELHTKAGRLVKRESDMLGSIFDLAAVEVGRVMIHRKHMELIDAGQPPAAIVAQVLASVHTRLPIWRDDPDNIVGVLHVKDLLRTMAATEFAIEKLDIAAIATPPWFVPETTSLAEQLNSFRARRAHFALVVDEYGTLMGLVTLKDIIEEIVGDIRDEHDRPQVGGVRREADGAFIVDGTVTIRELNREFDWALPDQDATTVAGLVMFEARVIPDQGQVFVFHGFKFQVLRRQRNQITLLRITPLDSATRPDRGDTPAPRRTSTAA